MSTEPAPLASPMRHASSLLRNIENICSRYQLASLRRQIDSCRKLLSTAPLIDIAVLGQFKAGKSSFLNSLIGKSVLPVGVVPVTTVITCIQYGEQERAVVSFFDGSRIEVDLSRLEDFTSEAKNPSNKKNVETVDIELPVLKNYPGLRLVDTPGMGSILKTHMEISEGWLPEVGAAILAISADRPLSGNDLQLIRGLARHTPKVVLLLTKVDLLSPEQQSEVVKFFSDSLKRELNRELPLFFYSNRSGTDQFRDRLNEELLFELSRNRDFESRKILQHKVLSLAGSCLGYLDMALSASRQADMDRDQLRNKILDEKLNYDLLREELYIISRENQRQTRPLIAGYLENIRKPLKTKIMNQLTREIEEWDGNLWRLTRKYEDWVAETMTEEMRQVSRTEHRHFFGTLKKAHAGFDRSLEAFRNHLGGNVKKVLGKELSYSEFNLEVAEPSQPDIRTPVCFDIHLDLIWFLIPMFIFRPLFERNFLSKLPREIETNLSRLAAQWEDTINRMIEQMRKQAVRYVGDELATIEGLLSNAQGRTDEIMRDMDELRAQEEILSCRTNHIR
ncbi:MAG: dynamin family protein [Syntrophales bacterium]|nr:dynamin family protein [Syntrophales bacterium]